MGKDERQKKNWNEVNIKDITTGLKCKVNRFANKFANWLIDKTKEKK